MTAQEPAVALTEEDVERVGEAIARAMGWPHATPQSKHYARAALSAMPHRASEAELVAALRPVRGWLKYAYGHVSSVTSEKVKAHLPVIEALLSKHTEE